MSLPHQSLDSTPPKSGSPVPSPFGDFTALPFDVRALIWEQLMARPIPEARRPHGMGSSSTSARQAGSLGLQTIQESSNEVSQEPKCKPMRHSNLAILQTSKALNEEILHQRYASRTISLGLHADHMAVDVLNKELKHQTFDSYVYHYVDWKRLKAIVVHVLPPPRRSEFVVQVLQLRRLMQLFVERLHKATELPVVIINVCDSDADPWAVDGAVRRSLPITDLTTGHKMSDLDMILSPLRQLHDRLHSFWISLPEVEFDWQESVILGPGVPGKWERTNSQSLEFMPTVGVDWGVHRQRPP
ncbi:hypothetical protein MMC30_009227 [Trapelia coarctata]|nr:hypothetical protein [Trapelia coarctata]